MSDAQDSPRHFTASLGGTYQLERDLGGGGMSHVYVALDTSLGRRVVIKQLSFELAGAVNAERFNREIRLAARLQHAHIVPLLAAGESDGRPFFTMPYVDGETLAARIARDAQVSLRSTTRILQNVASALAYAHQNGIVHRDIKPANILLSGDTAVVTDFGVAKALSDAIITSSGLTSVGVSLGTPTYMAPEQAAGDPNVDHRADIYAFGIMAYEMVTGAPPFSGKSVSAILAAHVTQLPEPVWKKRPDLPPVLSALIMRCLEKDPDRRPANAGELVTALEDTGAPSAQAVAASHKYLSSLGATGWRRRRALMFAAAALVVFGSVGAWRLARSREGAAHASAAPVTSIAVMPFAGSADSTDEYFRDGMTDQIIVALGSVPELRVASRMSAFAFKGRDVRPEELGRQLKVDNILTGSVQRSGDRIRVLVQLVRAADGSGIWSNQIEMQSNDVFRMQDSVSHAVLAKLRLGAGGGAQRRLAGAGTTNLAAYDLYLRARHQFNKFDEAPLRESIKLYDQAIALDPQFAQAWAGIAVSWLFLADDYVAPRIAYPAAKAAAQRALSFDSTIADAHAALGAALYQHEWKFDEGGSEVARAMALNPHSFVTQLSLHAYLLVTGRLDSALAVLRRAEKADPLSVLNALLLGRFYGILGHPQDAINEYRRVVQLAPPLTPIAMIPIAQATYALGRKAEGDSILRAAKTMLGPDMDFLAAVGEAAAGHKAEALRLAARYEALAGQTYVRPDLIAAIYVRLGDLDATFKWLERGVQDRSPYVLTLQWDRQWDPIRSDPRYAALLRRIGAQ